MEVWPLCGGMCWKQLRSRYGLGRLARLLDAHSMTLDRVVGTGERKSHGNIGQDMSAYLRIL